MISRTTSIFRQLYAALPEAIRVQAKKAYTLFLKDLYHPSLFFKKVHTKRPIYAARLSLDFRTVGIIDENEIVWFWIGKHSEYEQLLKRL